MLQYTDSGQTSPFTDQISTDKVIKQKTQNKTKQQ